MPIKVLIVDDTILYRKVIGDILKNEADIEVIGTANNGKTAISRIESLKPDLLTLDIEMPVCNGLEVLEYLREHRLSTGVIMLSSLTRKGGELTMKSLELGAFDFIPKPEGSSLAENQAFIKENLPPKIKAYARRQAFRKSLNRTPQPDRGKDETPTTMPETSRQPWPQKTAPLPPRRLLPSSIIAIGISTGGPNALTRMLPMLTAPIGAPIVIVQHMPPLFTKSLAASLDHKCSLQVKEGEDGETLKNDVVYIAPGGKQMKIVADASGPHGKIRLTDDAPENNCKPSADYLFRSVASLYRERVTGVIMTGMGSDGCNGLRLIKRHGAPVIAQDEESCVVYGMPREAVNAGIVDISLPLDLIAAEIMKTLSKP
ncbi:MAG TPA: chemotaxis response regulator protein-glutamate methylesterase [Proteobacteria bacterium]|mgnify:CR=1 FL=1|nr:chemotaxis response regulator protein-glutamate methylesterase [Pseudomonadota bacterium]